jgi:serine/threonine protein kinase
MRFEREAQSAARISHRNVPAIYRVGRFEGDLPYIVMEYIDGRNVRDMLASGKTFDVTEARMLVGSVASALAAAHEHGIVHRDVQVGNVFVENGTDRVLLADFGIAALLDTGSSSAPRLTAAGVRVGDVRYMSPEQVRGEPVTEQSDMYALGLLAYEILTGAGPYLTRSTAEVARAHLETPPRPLQEQRPDVDPSFAQLIERCLAKQPSQRPRARDVTAALSTALTEARSPLGQFRDELQRRRVYRVFVAYIAFAVTVFGVVQVVYEAFQLSRLSYQIIVGGTLAGLPVALVISWLYDIGAGGIIRAKASESTRRVSTLKWIALGLIVAVAGLLGWLLLR